MLPRLLVANDLPGLGKVALASQSASYGCLPSRNSHFTNGALIITYWWLQTASYR